MKLQYYKNLTGVRAIAALLVMLLHFSHSMNTNTFSSSLFFNIVKIGQTGVTLFFVLSGFLITRILINTKNKQDYFKNFYIRRTLRIFPLYYLFLVLYFYAFPFIFNETTDYSNSSIYFFTYLQNFAYGFHWITDGPDHYWSLAVEEHFYLFWPLLIYFLNRKQIIRIIYFLILFSIIMRLYMHNKGYNVMFFSFGRLDSFAFGALLSFYEIKNIFTPKNAKKFIYTACATSFFMFFLWYFFNTIELVFQSFKYTIWSIFFFSTIGFVLSIKKTHFINKLLTSTFFTYTGKISYGLYIYHLFVYKFIKTFFNFHYWGIRLLVSFIVTYIIASISYYFFERYFLNLKKYFS